MRKLAKGPKPTVLANNDANWTTELLAAVPGTTEFRQIEARYGNAGIRAALADETHHKCAYCESHIESVGFPHVEHIRPKSKHRDMTFTWENLTIACQVCNTRKGTTDPRADNFVHPYHDEPEHRFHFFGPLMASPPNDLAARNMINWIDLNRGPLVISRSEIASRVHQIYLEAVALPVSSRREFLRLAMARMASAESRHSRVAECMAHACETEYAQLIER